jgi:hypothetical protein
MLVGPKRGGHEMMLTAYMDTTSGTKNGRIRESDWSEPSLGRYSRRSRFILSSNDGLTGQRWLGGSVVL